MSWGLRRARSTSRFSGSCCPTKVSAGPSSHRPACRKIVPRRCRPRLRRRCATGNSWPSSEIGSLIPSAFARQVAPLLEPAPASKWQLQPASSPLLEKDFVFRGEPPHLRTLGKHLGSPGTHQDGVSSNTNRRQDHVHQN